MLKQKYIMYKDMYIQLFALVAVAVKSLPSYIPIWCAHMGIEMGRIPKQRC
jgi:hypothetical protein